MAATAKATETKIMIDRAAHTITMTRSFEAPRERVFEAWTRPEQIICWWDPSGVRLADCEVDLRPGGRFKFVNREIAPPERLVFEAMGSVGTVILEDAGDKTFMTVTIKCASPEHLEQFVRMGVDVGTSRTLANLVAHVAAMHR